MGNFRWDQVPWPEKGVSASPRPLLLSFQTGDWSISVQRNGVEVDAERGTATLRGGATTGELLNAAQDVGVHTGWPPPYLNSK